MAFLEIPSNSKKISFKKGLKILIKDWKLLIFLTLKGTSPISRGTEAMSCSENKFLNKTFSVQIEEEILNKTLLIMEPPH